MVNKKLTIINEFGTGPSIWWLGFSPLQDAGKRYSATETQQREARFDKMVSDLGVNEDGVLKASSTAMIDALDHALSVAPRPRIGL